MDAFSMASVLREANVDLMLVADQIIGLLPVVIPVLIGVIAIRKGLSFLTSTMHSV